MWEQGTGNREQVSNPGEPSCPPLRLAPCAGCCRKISCGSTCHRVKKYRLRRNTSFAGAAQPDRKGTRHQGVIDGIHTHATFESINSPICPPCSTHALATGNEGTWQGLPCQVSPDFCQTTKIGARLGIRRTVQQLGAPANFKTLTARTLLAPSTPCATKRAASSSEYGTAQGGVRVQALVPLKAGRMRSYQQMLRRPHPRQEPLTPATVRPLAPFGR